MAHRISVPSPTKAWNRLTLEIVDDSRRPAEGPSADLFDILARRPDGCLSVDEIFEELKCERCLVNAVFENPDVFLFREKPYDPFD